MPRLIVSSAAIIGTSGSDLVVGQEDNAFPAIGIEDLKNGVIDTQGGNDTIEGSGTGGVNIGGYTGTGIANSGIINAGKGDDTIFGTGTGGEGYRYYDGPGIGISNTQGGYINGGDGKDSIKGTGKGQEDSFQHLNSATGINNTQDSRIDGGFGDDEITGTGIGVAYGPSTGISNTEGSNINGGEGNDSINGTATGGFATKESTGIFNSGGSVISGGKGNDFISAIGNGSDAEEAPVSTYISNAGRGIGIINSGTISLGDGKDTIIGTGISLGTGIVNTNGIICGGAGDDTLTGYGTKIGIQGGTIDGGNGNDYFKARRIDDDNGNAVSDQGGAIADVVLRVDLEPTHLMLVTVMPQSMVAADGTS